MARTLARERPDREEVLWPVQKACPACGHLEHDRVRLTRSCSCFLLERAIHARCRRADARQPQTIARYFLQFRQIGIRIAAQAGMQSARLTPLIETVAKLLPLASIRTA